MQKKIEQFKYLLKKFYEVCYKMKKIIKINLEYYRRKLVLRAIFWDSLQYELESLNFSKLNEITKAQIYYNDSNIFTIKGQKIGGL